MGKIFMFQFAVAAALHGGKRFREEETDGKAACGKDLLAAEQPVDKRREILRLRGKLYDVLRNEEMSSHDQINHVIEVLSTHDQETRDTIVPAFVEHAAENGNIDHYESLLQAFPDIISQKEGFEQELITAVLSANIDPMFSDRRTETKKMMRHLNGGGRADLLEWLADANSNDAEESVLMWAAFVNRFELVEELLLVPSCFVGISYGRSRRSNSKGHNPLMAAVQANSYESAEIILRVAVPQGAKAGDFDGPPLALLQDKQGFSSFHHASNVRMLDLLVNTTANKIHCPPDYLDMSNHYHATPAFRAAARGDIELLSRLLDHGAAIAPASNEMRWDVFVAAAQHGQTEVLNFMVNYLVEKDENFNVVEALTKSYACGSTLIHHACMISGEREEATRHAGFIKTLQALLPGDQMAMLVNRPDDQDRTPLFSIVEDARAKQIDLSCIEALLECGADPDSGEAPALVAAVQRSNNQVSDMVRLIASRSKPASIIKVLTDFDESVAFLRSPNFIVGSGSRHTKEQIVQAEIQGQQDLSCFLLKEYESKIHELEDTPQQQQPLENDASCTTSKIWSHPEVKTEIKKESNNSEIPAVTAKKEEDQEKVDEPPGHHLNRPIPDH